MATHPVSVTYASSCPTPTGTGVQRGAKPALGCPQEHADTPHGQWGDDANWPRLSVGLHGAKVFAHCFSVWPSALPGGQHDAAAHFTGDKAEAQRGEGTAAQPVCGRARVRTQGSVPSKTKFSSTLQTAVLIEDSRGSMCMFTYVHVCMGYDNGCVST